MRSSQGSSSTRIQIALNTQPQSGAAESKDSTPAINCIRKTATISEVILILILLTGPGFSLQSALEDHANAGSITAGVLFSLWLYTLAGCGILMCANTKLEHKVRHLERKLERKELKASRDNLPDAVIPVPVPEDKPRLTPSR